MKDNIILIGMPGVGKSTSGVILAKILGYDFIDSDLLIQKEQNMRLSELIAKYGVEGFWTIENRVNASIRADHAVIATGGSAVYGREAMEHFKEIGTIVYLHASYNTIARRLKNLKKRGVTLREGQSLKNLYDERIPLYRQYADITVEQDRMDIEGTVEQILSRL